VKKIHAVLGYEAGGDWRAELAWDGRLAGRKVAESAILFPRPETKAT
jgi:methionyl-tRNA synthetase